MVDMMIKEIFGKVKIYNKALIVNSVKRIRL